MDNDIDSDNSISLHSQENTIGSTGDDFEEEEVFFNSDLVSLAVNKCITSSRPLAELSEVMRCLCDQPHLVKDSQLAPLLPTEATLLSHYLGPLYDTVLDQIRKLIDGHKCFLALSRRPLDAPDQVVTFVMVGTLFEDKVGDLFMLNAVLNLFQSGSNSEQLLFHSVKQLWPEDTEKHAANNILLYITDDNDEYLSEEAMKYFPKMILVNGYEEMLSSLARDYGSIVDTQQRPSDKYFYEELCEAVQEAIDTIRDRAPLNEVIDAIETVWSVVQEWSDESETNLLHTDAWVQNALAYDYETLVNISEQLFNTKHESIVHANGSLEEDALQPEDKEALRYAPLGGLTCAACFPSFDAILTSLPVKQLGLLSVLYCNSSLINSATDGKQEE